MNIKALRAIVIICVLIPLVFFQYVKTNRNAVAGEENHDSAVAEILQNSLSKGIDSAVTTYVDACNITWTVDYTHHNCERPRMTRSMTVSIDLNSLEMNKIRTETRGDRTLLLFDLNDYQSFASDKIEYLNEKHKIPTAKEAYKLFEGKTDKNYKFRTYCDFNSTFTEVNTNISIMLQNYDAADASKAFNDYYNNCR